MFWLTLLQILFYLFAAVLIEYLESNKLIDRILDFNH